jgi:uncharacterized protein
VNRPNLKAIARRFVAIGACALCISSHAASFDCAKANSPLEHAICNDAELSALDSELTQSYNKALNGQGDDTVAFRDAQRAWLKSRPKSGSAQDIDALKSMYRERIGQLAAIPVFPAPDQAVDGPTFRIHAASKQFDFKIRMLNACEIDKQSAYQTCEGPGQVLVFRKGDERVLQRIDMQNIFVAMAGSNTPLVNSAKLYDYQGAINVGDFNFDGREDFAIQNGNNGGYGGPSYDVYLFDPTTGRFNFNEPMSQLIEETLGFFEVDRAKKVLRTTAKSGCCYHEFTTYRVEKNAPVAIARRIEALTADGEKMEITDERLINGKWRSKTRYEPAPR